MAAVRVVVSTRNSHKLEELQALLAPLGLAPVPGAELGVPEVEETGTTLEANAMLKAVAGWTVAVGAAGDALCLSDDSGLEVDALDGAPGVYSARFAGEDVTYADNNRLLLAKLADTPEPDRGARFRCSLCLIAPVSWVRDDAPGSAVADTLAEDGAPAWRWARVAPGGGLDSGAVAAFQLDGHVGGQITREAAGDQGFGYDPLFLHAPSGLTFAQLSGAEKHAVSHRGRALHALADCLATAVRPL